MNWIYLNYCQILDVFVLLWCDWFSTTQSSLCMQMSWESVLHVCLFIWSFDWMSGLNESNRRSVPESWSHKLMSNWVYTVRHIGRRQSELGKNKLRATVNLMTNCWSGYLWQCEALTCLLPGGAPWVPGCSRWPCWFLLGRGLPSLLRPPASAISTPLSSLRVWPLSDSWDRVAPGRDILMLIYIQQFNFIQYSLF